MVRMFFLSVLVMLTIAGALLEGLVETVPPRFSQFHGLLLIVCTVAFIASSLKFRFARTGS